jgi:hypothetical protein
VETYRWIEGMCIWNHEGERNSWHFAQVLKFCRDQSVAKTIIEVGMQNTLARVDAKSVSLRLLLHLQAGTRFFEKTEKIGNPFFGK